MSTLPEVLLGFGSLYSTLVNRTPGFLGGLDAGAQTAAIVFDATSAATSNPALTSVSIMASGVGFATSTAILASDYSAGKFNAANGPLLLAADFTTVVGNIAGFVGGLAALTPAPTGPVAQALGHITQIVADATTVLGLSAQAEIQRNENVSPNLPANLTDTIGLLLTSVNSFNAALQTSGNPQSEIWSVLDSALSSFLTPIQNALTTNNGATFLTDVGTVVNEIGSLDTTILNAFNSIVVGNSTIASQTTEQQNAALYSFSNAYQKSGYYIAQAGDTSDSIIGALSNGGTVNTISTDTLLHINAAFGVVPGSDGVFAAGTLLHVPTGTAAIVNGNLPPLPAGQTYVFDASSDTTYVVGSSLDLHDSGALIIDHVDFAGNFPTFAAGTYSNVTMQPDGEIDVTLVDSGPLGGTPTTLGTLALSSSGVLDSFTLTDGTVIPLTGDTNSAHIAASTPNTPGGRLENYLTQLGASTTTAAQLDAAHQAYLATANEPATQTITFGNGHTLTLDQGSYSSLTYQIKFIDRETRPYY